MTIEKKRAGRPPKWKQGITPKYYKMPNDLIEKLKKLVKEGVYESEVEAIYYLIMKSDEEKDKEIAKLKRELEAKDAHIEALQKRIAILESEKAEIERKYHELLKEHEEVVKELMSLKAHSDVLISEKESVEVVKEKGNLWSLVERYLEIMEMLYKVSSESENVRLEREKTEIQRQINAILESFGVDKFSFWRVLTSKGLDEAKKLLGE